MPTGVPGAQFSVNNSNAASNTTATFFAAGSYTFLVTISDSDGIYTTSTAGVTVAQTPTGVAVSPGLVAVPVGSSTQFTPAVTDQFGNAIGSPSLSWSVTGSGNSINNSGDATFGATPGSFEVTATDGAVQGSANVNVENFAIQSGSTLDINLNGAGPVSISSSGSIVTAQQNGVQPSFTGITALNVTDTASGSVLNFNGPLTLPITLLNCGTSTINVNSGVLTLAGAPGGNVVLGTLNILAGGGAAMAVSPTNTVTGFVLDSLSIASTGQLDVGNNQLFINYGSAADPIVSISLWIQSGYAGGPWNGYGIISTAAKTHPLYALGYADAADPGNPAKLASGQIEILYTLLGDANLDGEINGEDFVLMSDSFNDYVTAGWDRGDFNYSNTVNGNDFTLLSNNFNQWSQIVAPGAPAPPVANTTSAAPSGLSTPATPNRHSHHRR
jgi:hypothetical protein